LKSVVREGDFAANASKRILETATGGDRLKYADAVELWPELQERSLTAT